MDVPAEEEGGVTAEGDGADERFPGWVEEELYEGDELEDDRQEEGCLWGDVREDGEGGVAYEAAGYTVDCFLIDWQAEVGCDCDALVGRGGVGLRNVLKIRMRSVKEYIAQMLGAQYAWQRPLEKGKSLPRSCCIWPQ